MTNTPAGQLPENVCGKRVKGTNFFGRQAEVARVWSRLQTDNLLLSAPRRMGKSSLMLELLAKAPERRWQAVYMSAEDAVDERDFVAKLFAEVARSPEMGEVAARLEKLKWGRKLSEIRKLSVASLALELSQSAPDGWEILAAELENSLFRLSSGRRVLLMIDELPVFLLALLRASPERALTFLRWFRALRHGPVGRSDELRWLVAGSIGLAPLARRERWSAQINDLFPVSLGAFSAEIARDFLLALGQRYRLPLDAAAAQQILEVVGWPIPFFLQLFVSEIRDRPPGPLEPEAIEEVREALLGLDARKHFSPWWERLSDELGATDAVLARRMLSACAVDPEGATRDTLRALVAGHHLEEEREERFLWLLEVLENDGYLVEAERRWSFRSPLLRAVWTRWGSR